MNQEQLLNDFLSLPPVAQQEAIDFLSFLKLRYSQSSNQKGQKLSNIQNEPFVGMWRSRADMSDSNTWVRDLRKAEWG